MEMQLKENLRKFLEERGIKAADLARLSGVSPSVISEWMSGRKPRNIQNLQKIAEQFGISLGELCFGRLDASPFGALDEKKRKKEAKGKEIFPLVLPIQESGILEFQVRWTPLAGADEKG